MPLVKPHMCRGLHTLVLFELKEGKPHTHTRTHTPTHTHTHQVIHPAQVGVVQEAFTPPTERLTWAKGLISAFEQHQTSGQVCFPSLSHTLSLSLSLSHTLSLPQTNTHTHTQTRTHFLSLSLSLSLHLSVCLFLSYVCYTIGEQSKPNLVIPCAQFVWYIFPRQCHTTISNLAINAHNFESCFTCNYTPRIVSQQCIAFF